VSADQNEGEEEGRIGIPDLAAREAPGTAGVADEGAEQEENNNI
jgi:hypothetical protein